MVYRCFSVFFLAGVGLVAVLERADISVIRKPVFVTVLISRAGSVHAVITLITGAILVDVQLFWIVGVGTVVAVIGKTIFVRVRPVGFLTHGIIFTQVD
jgi:hypothetical protein